MNNILTILTVIGGISIVLWVLLWTYIRWQKVLHNKYPDRTLKNIWWGLLFIGLIFLFASLGVWFSNH